MAITGTAESVDVIYAGAGNDTVQGGAWVVGAGDYLCGGLGNDSLMGGPGDDHVAGDGGNDRVDGGNGGDDLLEGGDGRDSVMDTNDCEFEDPGVDYLWGGSGPDYVCSYRGRDVLRGGGGNDWVLDPTLGGRGSTAGLGTTTCYRGVWARRAANTTIWNPR